MFDTVDECCKKIQGGCITKEAEECVGGIDTPAVGEGGCEDKLWHVSTSSGSSWYVSFFLSWNEFDLIVKTLMAESSMYFFNFSMNDL